MEIILYVGTRQEQGKSRDHKSKKLTIRLWFK